jgi:type IV pilus assembly protein PilN
VIRVNLLRNISGGVGPANLGTGITAMPELSKEGQKQAALRLAVIFGAVGLLWFYEHNEITAKNQQLAQVQAQIAEVQAAKQRFGDAGPIVEKYNKQKDILAAQIKVLEGLTINRLREVKLLDALQSLIPQKAWLESIISDKGHVKIKGFAPDAETVNNLFRQLENNVLFSQVQQTTNVDQDVPEVGLLRRFEFEFIAGRPER